MYDDRESDDYERWAEMNEPIRNDRYTEFDRRVGYAIEAQENPAMRNMSDSVKIAYFDTLVEQGIINTNAITDDYSSMVNVVRRVFEAEGASPDKKINCIKVVRNMLGLGLKESKDLVDGHCERSISTSVLRHNLGDMLSQGTQHLTPQELSSLAMSATTNSPVDMNRLVSEVADRLTDIPF